MLAGSSASVVVTAKFTVSPGFTVRSAGRSNVGGRFTSVTVIVNELVAVSGGVPLSPTSVVKVRVDGPWASDGVQVMTPVVEMSAQPGACALEFVGTRIPPHTKAHSAKPFRVCIANHCRFRSERSAAACD